MAATDRRRAGAIRVGMGLVVVGAIGVFAWRATGPGQPAPVAEVADVVPVASSTPTSPAVSTLPAPATVLAPMGMAARLPVGGPTIKLSPTQLQAYDGESGTLAIDSQAIRALKHGEYVVSQFGDATIAHRVHRNERRDDHVHVAMQEVDPLDGKPNGFHSSYHLYDNGGVTHYVNSEAVAFEIYGPADASIPFENGRKRPALVRAEPDLDGARHPH